MLVLIRESLRRGRVRLVNVLSAHLCPEKLEGSRLLDFWARKLIISGQEDGLTRACTKIQIPLRVRWSRDSPLWCVIPGIPFSGGSSGVGHSRSLESRGLWGRSGPTPPSGHSLPQIPGTDSRTSASGAERRPVAGSAWCQPTSLGPCPSPHTSPARRGGGESGSAVTATERSAAGPRHRAG